MCVCVRACVLADPSGPHEKFTRTDPTFTHTHTHAHTHTHTSQSNYTLTQTYQKASQGVFPSSVKAVILYLGYLWQRNQPPTNHSCSGRSLKSLFSINSVQIIYFIYTLNTVSAETTQNLQTICPLIRCHSVLISVCWKLLFYFVQFWTSKLD